LHPEDKKGSSQGHTAALDPKFDARIPEIDFAMMDSRQECP